MMHRTSHASRFARPLALLAVFLTLVVGVGRAQAQADAPAATPAKPKVTETYRLQPGDELAITVVPQKEYDTGGAILPDGKLYLKSVGEIQAAGMTLKELTDTIRKELDKELRNPLINVTVTKLATLPRPKITVTGAVGKTGPLDLDEGLRLRKALELSGGTVPDADLSKVSVIRKDLKRVTVDLSSPEKALDPNINILLEDGDSIDVPVLPNRISVGGSVAKGGLLPLEADLRVRKAIDISGGPTLDADLTKVTIIHRDLSKTVVDVSVADKITDPTQNLLLKDGDSVQVPALFKTGFVQVGGPGISNVTTVDLKPGMALDELVITTGKPTAMANLEEVVLRRAGAKEQVINMAPGSKEGEQIRLEPGDSVYVREYADRVLFLAPTPTAGQRPLKPGQKLSDFVSNETGVFDVSKVDMKKAQYLKKGAPKATKIDLVKILGNPNDPANVELTPGDVIVVPPKEPKGPKNDWMRNIPYLGTILTLLL